MIFGLLGCGGCDVSDVTVAPRDERLSLRLEGFARQVVSWHRPDWAPQTVALLPKKHAIAVDGSGFLDGRAWGGHDDLLGERSDLASLGDTPEVPGVPGGWFSQHPG